MLRLRRKEKFWILILFFGVICVLEILVFFDFYGVGKLVDIKIIG